MYPSIIHARVQSVDAELGLIYVQSTSLALPLPVRPIHYGHGDGVRVRQAPLPVPSTWGVCLFPYGDARNGVWLGAYYPSLVDARTAGDPNADYTAYYSGGWQLIDGVGRHTMVYPDGTYFTISDSTTPPVPTRHVVNEAQVQSAAPFTQSERVPSPPGAFYLFLRHTSGTTVEIDPSGNVTINGAS